MGRGIGKGVRGVIVRWLRCVAPWMRRMLGWRRAKGWPLDVVRQTGRLYSFM